MPVTKPAALIKLESAHDVLRGARHALDVFFSPSSVAVVGATERESSVGRTIFRNLLGSPFGGAVFPINPKRPHVLGVKAYPDVASLPEPADLAVIVTPAETVPGVVAECASAGVKGAIVISAGFKELGAEGAELERRVLEEARKGRIRIIGPNCLGIMCPVSGLNATFAASMARAGSIGFVSQSGALCTAVLDWSFRAMVGFSAFVSIGSMADVGWGDLIDYLGDDPRTRSIILYMESIGDARSFLSAAREVALSKPIIVIKAGRSAAAARAAASHTGSLTGSDDVLDAAFRRSGVLRVSSIGDLFSMADVLSKQPRPKGPRLAILTNAGGPGVLATDALVSEGGELAQLSEQTVKALDEFLPPAWSHNNPIDILGDASAERYAKAVSVTAKDPIADGLLAILTPQAMTDPTQTAEQLKGLAKLDSKPILASWMGGADVMAGEDILSRAGIPTFDYPDAAARVFNYMWKYSYNLRGLYETPLLAASSETGAGREKMASEIIRRLRATGRTILTEAESKEVLKAYSIPVVETRVAKTEDEAVEQAEALGYPVAVKLHSETITHKSDVGGVHLNIASGTGVREAWKAIQKSAGERAGAGHFHGVAVEPMICGGGYELIVGSSLDAQFGPVLLFGTGGKLVEVFKDRALALPPLNTTLARRMMEQTRIYKALGGVRGEKPVDLAELERLLVRFSDLVVSQPAIKEIDINPLLASADRLVALDARVVLHEREVADEKLPRPAIRPYPTRYVSSFTMKDGTAVVIRPIRPEDEPLMVRFHAALSERSVYLRYFHMIALSQRVAHDRLTRICFNDYDREWALVAERKNETGQPEILAVGRLTRQTGTTEAQFAVLVTDAFQGKGLGEELVRRLVEIGRREKLTRITSDTLPDNGAMRHITEKLGFQSKLDSRSEVVRSWIDL